MAQIIRGRSSSSKLNNIPTRALTCRHYLPLGQRPLSARKPRYRSPISGDTLVPISKHILLVPRRLLHHLPALVTDLSQNIIHLMFCPPPTYPRIPRMLPDMRPGSSVNRSLRITLLAHSPLCPPLHTPSPICHHKLHTCMLPLYPRLRPFSCRLICRRNRRSNRRFLRIPSATSMHHHPCMGTVTLLVCLFD